MTGTADTRAEQVAWSASDGELAAAVWEKLSPPARSLFSVLMDHPGTRYSGEELVGLLGLEKGKHGVAGLLGWPRRHCLAVGRTWLWEWEYPRGETACYWVTAEIAALFQDVRAN
ncbi:DUF6416 domain-containing protein [Lentzea albida]|uniref:Uncharacterized protein n=1 Tax=Lentzea albida TaxID=65499 RepID=A0A1H9UR52_9PSEU|nr:DUF6416 domain-containing protein [Lentzea albida]SES11975.1 hypothetical protein SAMN04488000_11693 [Lentzea albida]